MSANLSVSRQADKRDDSYSETLDEIRLVALTQFSWIDPPRPERIGLKCDECVVRETIFPFLWFTGYVLLAR